MQMKDPVNELPKAPAIPLDQYAGKWIAWDRERQRIIASGNTLSEVTEAAAAAGEAEPMFEKVRKTGRFIGAAR
jgi:hypothetical protein